MEALSVSYLAAYFKNLVSELKIMFALNKSAKDNDLCHKTLVELLQLLQSANTGKENNVAVADPNHETTRTQKKKKTTTTRRRFIL